MTIQIEDQTREQIAAFLPEALRKAIAAYHSFILEEGLKDDKKSNAKDFEEHHKACKVAASHIELLLKLAKLADLPDAGAQSRSEQATLDAMMRLAVEDLQEFNNNPGNEDE